MVVTSAEPALMAHDGMVKRIQADVRYQISGVDKASNIACAIIHHLIIKRPFRW